MPLSTLTSKGQVTLPKEIRDYLRVETGAKLDFIIQDDGQVVLKTMDRPIGELKGFLRLPGRKAVSLEAMRAAIKAKAARMD